MANEHATSAWDALCDVPGESENLRIRSKLMRTITKTVKSWDVPQSEAAHRLHITQQRLNDLLKGKIDKFPLDALVSLLASAGLEIHLPASTFRR